MQMELSEVSYVAKGTQISLWSSCFCNNFELILMLTNDTGQYMVYHTVYHNIFLAWGSWHILLPSHFPCAGNSMWLVNISQDHNVNYPNLPNIGWIANIRKSEQSRTAKGHHYGPQPVSCLSVSVPFVFLVLILNRI